MTSSRLHSSGRPAQDLTTFAERSFKAVNAGRQVSAQLAIEAIARLEQCHRPDQAARIAVPPRI